MKITSVQSSKEILECLDVMKALRPKLNEATIAGVLQGMMERGYHLNVIKDDQKAICAIGYRFTEHLAWGKVIYIDDLSTLPEARGKGYASRLLDHVIQFARHNNCNSVHLDSGLSATRYDAHRLYLKRGFNITSHHFSMEL